MFSLPNPKKTITIEFSIDQVMKGIPRISAASDTKYNVTEKFRLKFASGFYSQNLISVSSDRDIVNLFYGFQLGSWF